MTVAHERAAGMARGQRLVATTPPSLLFLDEWVFPSCLVPEVPQFGSIPTELTRFNKPFDIPAIFHAARDQGKEQRKMILA